MKNFLVSLPRLHKFLLVVLPILIFLLFLAAYIYRPKNQEIGTPKPTPGKQPIITRTVTLPGTTKIQYTYPFDITPFATGVPVGEIIVYQGDLDTGFGTYYQKKDSSNKDKWNKTVLLLLNDAIIQNEGIKLGLYPKGDGKLNYNNIHTAKEYIDKNLISHLSMERITIFFNNYMGEGNPNPKVGIPEGKKIAYTVLSDLRTKVVNGQYTMRQAGQAIAGMSTLKDVDIAYKNNAYHTYTNLLPSDTPFDPELMNIAWTLNTGEVSDVLMSKTGTTEYYYTVIKVIDKKTGQYKSMQELIDQRKKEGLNIKI